MITAERFLQFNELLGQYLEENTANRRGSPRMWELQQKMFDEFLTDAFPFMKDVRGGASVGPGWIPLLVELCEKIDEILKQHPDLRFHVDQVKEKFGTLRFYASTYSEAMTKEDGRPYQMVTNPEHESAKNKIYDLITEAETKSEVICEYCSDPGKLTGRTWLKTTCATHE